MFTRPDDLSDSDIARALTGGWNLTPDSLDYAAVGFGSHHWRATAAGTRWFVTVDDLEARRREPSESRSDAGARLSAALLTARSLRDAGLAFVVAPTTSRSGAVLQTLDDRYVVALYPHINGETHHFGPYPSHRERLSILDRIAAIHGATPLVADAALTDDFLIPGRLELEAVLRNPSNDWGPGPRSDDARHIEVTPSAPRTASP